MDASVVVAVVSAAGALSTALFAGRASTRAGRIQADAADRVSERSADLEWQRLRDEALTRQREALDGIISRLTDELTRTQSQVGQLRQQLTEEQSVSDKLRERVRALEDQIHLMEQSITDLQRQLAANDLSRLQQPEPGI
jgi:predicted RNase H-like nuclease (RuvC/YqgF family)